MVRLIDYQRMVQHRPATGTRRTRLSTSLNAHTFRKQHYFLLATQEAIPLETGKEYVDKLIEDCQPIPAPQPTADGYNWDSPTAPLLEKARPPNPPRPPWFKESREKNQLKRLQPCVDRHRELVGSHAPPSGVELHPEIVNFLPGSETAPSAILARMFNAAVGDGLDEVPLSPRPLKKFDSWSREVIEKHEHADATRVQNQISRMLLGEQPEGFVHPARPRAKSFEKVSEGGSPKVAKKDAKKDAKKGPAKVPQDGSAEVAKKGPAKVSLKVPSKVLPEVSPSSFPFEASSCAERPSLQTLLEYLNNTLTPPEDLRRDPVREAAPLSEPNRQASPPRERVPLRSYRPLEPPPAVAADTYVEPTVTILRVAGETTRWERLVFRDERTTVERPQGTTVTLGVQASLSLEEAPPEALDSPREAQQSAIAVDPASSSGTTSPGATASVTSLFDVLAGEIDSKRVALSPFGRHVAANSLQSSSAPQERVLRQTPPALKSGAVESRSAADAAAVQFRAVDHPGPTLDFREERRKADLAAVRQDGQEDERLYPDLRLPSIGREICRSSEMAASRARRAVPRRAGRRRDDLERPQQDSNALRDSLTAQTIRRVRGGRYTIAVGDRPDRFHSFR